MKIKLFAASLALVLLLGMLAVLPGNAQEQVVLPSWFYDFSTGLIFSNISGNGFNLSIEITERSHTTLTALGGDPQLSLTAPGIYVDSAKYLCIEYRTESTNSGEIYISRNDGVGMGETPDSALKWKWNTDGEWHRLILYCEGWAEDEGVAFTALRFDPISLGLEECNGETIDIRFVAFFTNEQSAKDFDLAAYQDYVNKNGITLPEGVRPSDQKWPEPAYKEMDVHPDDNTEGTLKITCSEDGKYATISYGEGENAVSYTVPNNEVNLFGGYAGTDDLDRSLFDSSEVGVVTEDHDVGIFYFLWHGEHGDSGALNMQHIIDKVGIEQASKPDCELWGRPYEWHFWNEPLYGYYYIDDNWVMRKHVELLINAGVDFLYFDATNGYSYHDNALKLMAILHDFNKMGFDAPEVVFYTNTNAEACVQELYEKIYKSGFYSDTWYMLDGKPLIIAPRSANIDDFFTVKQPQWPTEAEKKNGWPWMDFEWPQHIYKDAKGNPSAINVSVAQHSGTVRFSDSALYGNTLNLGRSFASNVNDRTARSEYYERIRENPALYVQGLNFQAQWDRAIEADVPFVLVTGWNEWIAQRQNDPNKVGFVDCASNEFSRDIEMMKGGYFDNYYMQLAYNIQRLKGTAPVIVQDARNAVNVTGSFDVWDKVLITYTDPSKDMLDRDAKGFGDNHYVNDTGRNDIVASKVTADTKNVYFFVETRSEITLPEENTCWMQLFLDMDCDTETGWYGYDFIVNYSVKDNFTTTVARYNGTDGEYAFEIVGEIAFRAKENKMMIEIPMDLLGITNPNGIKFEFKWADSKNAITTMEQFYTDGDAAPLGRLNYTFQNCIDPETAEQYVPSEPQAPGEEQKRGCKAAVGSATLIVCIAALPFALIPKKKKH